jgi:hypothetical protein
MVQLTEQLTLALNSRPSSGDRPDPEQFLDEFFSEMGIARGTADCGAAITGGCPQSAGAGEDDQEAWIAPPTREDLLEELRTLLSAASVEKDQEKEGGVYRRIAEIVEQVDDENAAFVWWLHAAHAGDEVAVAIVDELALDLSAERPSVLQSIYQLQNTTR